MKFPFTACRWTLLVAISITTLIACEQAQLPPTPTPTIFNKLISFMKLDDACQILTAQQVERVLGRQVTRIFDQDHRGTLRYKSYGQDRWCEYELDDISVHVSLIRDKKTKETLLDNIESTCSIRPNADPFQRIIPPTSLPPAPQPLLQKSFKELWLMEWNKRQTCPCCNELFDEWKEFGAYINLHIVTGSVAFPNDDFILTIEYSDDKVIPYLTSEDNSRIIKITKELTRAALGQ